MESRGKQASDLSALIDELKEIDDVVGVVLFGSVARGDSDEFSDYDLLIFFKDKDSMWKRWDELFSIIGKVGIHMHAIPKGLDELEESNPIFLEEVTKYGRVLYSKYPFEVFLKPFGIEPYVIIFYKMNELSYRDKVRLRYHLYEKGGLLRVGGIKLGNSCIMVPEKSFKEILKEIEGFGAHVKTTKVFV